MHRAVDRHHHGDIHRVDRDVLQMMSRNNVVAKHVGRPNVACVPRETRG
jgi:hypothetical protein